MIDYSNFQSSLKNLEIQNQNYKGMDTQWPGWAREGIAESVIQRFETCYDCLWKILKKYMEESLGLTEVPAAPKPLCRLAFENSLLSSPVEQWFKYVNARIGTAHDYSGEKARDAIVLVDDFLGDAITLYQTMTGKAWK